MSVRLICEDCGHVSASALFYRGSEDHSCKQCGGPLKLVDPTQERRKGGDQRAVEDAKVRDTEWREGEDRRRSSRP